jgi:hypothetical protein
LLPESGIAAFDRRVHAQKRSNRTWSQNAAIGRRPSSCERELGEADAATFGVCIGLAIGLGESRSAEDGQEVADLRFADERVGEGQVGLDRVLVASTVARARDVAGFG